jgi:hypothetical protein
MKTSSVFYIEPLHVHLTSSTSKVFVDHYGFMEKKNKLNYTCNTLLQNIPYTQHNPRITVNPYKQTALFMWTTDNFNHNCALY